MNWTGEEKGEGKVVLTSQAGPAELMMYSNRHESPLVLKSLSTREGKAVVERVISKPLTL